MGVSHATARRNEEVGRPGDENRREAYADADDLLKEAKERGIAEGKRPPKGQRPPRMVEVGEGAGPADGGKREVVSGDAERKDVRRQRGGKAKEVAPAAGTAPAKTARQPAKSAVKKPDVVMPAAKRAKVNADSASAQVRRGVTEKGRKGGEVAAIPVRAEGDTGPRRQMSDVPASVENAPHKGRQRGDCD